MATALHDIPYTLRTMVQASEWLVLLVNANGATTAISAPARQRLRLALREPWTECLAAPHDGQALLRWTQQRGAVQSQPLPLADGSSFEFVVMPLGYAGAAFLIAVVLPDTAARQQRLIEVLTTTANAIQQVPSLDRLLRTLAETLNHNGLIVEPCLPGPDGTLDLSIAYWDPLLHNLLPPLLKGGRQVFLPISEPLFEALLSGGQARPLSNRTLIQLLGGDGTFDLVAQFVAPFGWIATPLRLADDQPGCLLFGGPLLRPSDAPLVNLFGQQLQSVISQLLMSEARALDQARQSSLLAVSQAVSARELGEALWTVCEEAVQMTGAEFAAVALPDSNPRFWRYSMAVGRQAELALGVRLPVGETLVGAALLSNCSELVDDVEALPHPDQHSAAVLGLRAVLLVPLQGQPAALGVLLLGHTEPGWFTAAHQQLLEQYAVLTALAVQRQQLQASLQFSEQRYRTLYENANDLAFSCDRAGNLTQWNGAMLRFLGISATELRGQVHNLYSWLPRRPSGTTLAGLRRLLSDVPVRTPLALQIVRPSGVAAVLEVTSQLITEHDHVVGVAVVGRDITERLDAQRQLQAQLDKLTLLSELSAALSTSFDIATILEHAATSLVAATGSQAVAIYLVQADRLVRMLGHGQGQSAPAVLVPTPQLAPALSEHQPAVLRATSIRRPAEARSSRRNLVALPLSTNQTTHGLILIGHLTADSVGADQLRFWQTLAEQIAQVVANAQLYQQVETAATEYRELYENANDLIGTVALDGRFLSLNRAMISFIGYPDDELPALRLRDLLPPHEQPRLNLLFRQMVHSPAHTTGYEQQICRRDGSLATLEICSRLVARDQDRSVVHFIARDITARRELEVQVRQSEKLAALGQMVAGTAHEINNPLSVVLGTTQLLRLSELAPAVAEDVATIEEAAQRARHIVQQLLTFARQQPSQFRPVDLVAVLQLALVAVRDGVQRSAIELLTDYEPAPALVLGDPVQLQQVAINLLQNAIQALGDGRAERRLVVALERGPALRLVVRDSGPGIAPLDMPRLFDPFFTTKPLGLGTGLGLSIVYGIIENHGGRVWAEFEAGRRRHVYRRAAAAGRAARHNALALGQQRQQRALGGRGAVRRCAKQALGEGAANRRGQQRRHRIADLRKLPRLGAAKCKAVGERLEPRRLTQIQPPHAGHDARARRAAGHQVRVVRAQHAALVHNMRAVAAGGRRNRQAGRRQVDRPALAVDQHAGPRAAPQHRLFGIRHDRVVGRAGWDILQRRARCDQRGQARPAVGWRRKHKALARPRADEKDPLAVLRHAKVRGQQLLVYDGVAQTFKLRNGPLNVGQVAHGEQPRHVLQQKRPRLRLANRPDKLWYHVARIVSRKLLASDRERLARRAARHQIKARELLEIDIAHIGEQRRIREIMPVRGGGRRVALHRRHDLPARSMQPQRQPARPSEEIQRS